MEVFGRHLGRQNQITCREDLAADHDISKGFCYAGAFVTRKDGKHGKENGREEYFL